MIYALKIISFFCFISLINAVSLKIDGLIDLGPNWSYEYRILSKPDNADPDLTNHSLQRLNAEHPHKDDEQLREDNKERDETAELRKSHKGSKHSEESYSRDKSSESHKHSKRKPEHHYKESKHHKESKRHKHEPKAETSEAKSEVKSNFKASELESDSYEKSSSSEKNEGRATKFDIDDFTTTKKSKKSHRVSRARHREFKSENVNEDAVSFIEDNNHHTHDGHPYSVPIKREKPPDIDEMVKSNVTVTNATIPTTKVVTNATIPTTTKVTTVRTANIYSDPHKVKDDAKIKEFSNHIYKRTLKVFDSVKHKTDQYHLKKKMDVLARSYDEKFHEFLKETNHQKIKTRLGTQKVILNTINVSNHMLRRLMNYVLGDMDRKGQLRNNVASANLFQKEIDKELKTELTHACKKFGICRTENGFPHFLIEILTIHLRSEEKKFRQSFDALTEVMKTADYHKVLEPQTEKELKSAVEKIERLPTTILRPVFMILRNIIANKNRPLIVNNVPGRLNATLAFLEVIDVFDQHLPQNESNILEWNDIKNSLQDFSDDKRYDVQDIMETLMKHLQKAISSMDLPSRKTISKNMEIILGVY